MVLGSLFFIILINDLSKVFINVNNINLNLYAKSKLSFNIHIDNINNKLTKIIYLKKILYLNIKNLILLYISLFLSNLSIMLIKHFRSIIS